MSDVTDITTLVRYLVEDFSKSMIPGDVFTYTTSNVFTLTEENVISVTGVFINDVEIGDSEYSFDSSNNKITITASLSSSDTIEVQYTYYPNYSNTEIESYIKGAIVHLSINNYYTYEIDTTGYVYPEITLREKNLLAFVTATLIEPGNQSYRLPDMTISNPKSLPTRDLISKSISIFKHNSHGNFDLT